MRKLILYIASSLDGFIARRDGSVDWLNEYDGKDDYGYTELMERIDTLLIGRKTYNQILGFEKWPYKGKKCYVFTKKINKSKVNDELNFINDIVGFTKKLKKEKGKDIWLVGGAEVISILINENLVDELILTIVPKVLNSGISLFKDINKLSLKLNKMTKYGNLIQLKYLFR